jgi:hypothetical protein
VSTPAWNLPRAAIIEREQGRMRMRDTDGQGGEGGTGMPRRLLIAVVLIGILGLIGELALLEHFETVWQWIPLVSLALGLVAGVALLMRPSSATVRTFRAIMLLFVAAGALGVWLHVRGNVEFEREMDPEMRGLALLWEALRGATPALAPGSLAHMGLMGLASTYRHPALRRGPASGGAPGAAPLSTEQR